MQDKSHERTLLSVEIFNKWLDSNSQESFVLDYNSSTKNLLHRFIEEGTVEPVYFEVSMSLVNHDTIVKIESLNFEIMRYDFI